MILLHRISVYLIVATIAGVFGLMLWQPVNIIFLGLVLQLLTLFLLMRILGFEWRSPSFWIFLLSPMALLWSAVLFLLFTEGQQMIWLIGIFTVILSFIYIENLFVFYHLPANYQPYALEYISLALYLSMVFFLASGLYAMKMFLLQPLYIPAGILFFVALLVCICVFWVSKVNLETSIIYAVAGAIAMTQFYVAIGMLPTSFIVNAAVLATMFYMYLGLSRAHVLEKLTKKVTVRYLVTGLGFTSIILLTAQWF